MTTYFGYLDQKLTDAECGHTLRFTREFAAAHSLAFTPIEAWLSSYGGYCDCEVLANVEEQDEGL